MTDAVRKRCFRFATRMMMDGESNGIQFKNEMTSPDSLERYLSVIQSIFQSN